MYPQCWPRIVFLSLFAFIISFELLALTVQSPKWHLVPSSQPRTLALSQRPLKGYVDTYCGPNLKRPSADPSPPLIQVFMTRRDALQCVHEPFGDAYYFGPEFMSERFEDDEAYRKSSGSFDRSYADILDSIQEEGEKEVRLSSTDFRAITTNLDTCLK